MSKTFFSLRVILGDQPLGVVPEGGGAGVMSLGELSELSE